MKIFKCDDFKINKNLKPMKLKDLINENITYKIRLSSTNNQGTIEKIFNLSVIKVVKAPSDIKLSNISFNENIYINSEISEIYEKNIGEKIKYTYKLVKNYGDNDKFKLNKNKYFQLQ
jgi:hypothetical protein